MSGISHYDITVKVVGSTSMAILADAIAEALGLRGFDEGQYEILVKGPPELCLGFVL